jgi:hypothetical protein
VFTSKNRIRLEAKNRKGALTNFFIELLLIIIGGQNGIENMLLDMKSHHKVELSHIPHHRDGCAIMSWGDELSGNWEEGTVGLLERPHDVWINFKEIGANGIQIQGTINPVVQQEPEEFIFTLGRCIAYLCLAEEVLLVISNGGVVHKTIGRRHFLLLLRL